MPLLNALFNIKAGRSAVFDHVAADDDYPHLGIIDYTDRPWTIGQYGDLGIWPVGHVLTDPGDDPDYSAVEQQQEAKPYLLVGPDYTIAIGSDNGREEIWVLSNANAFKAE